MSDHVMRNAVVALLGTPDRTEGSLNSPVEREEHGLVYNEKWSYTHLVSDPAGVPMRMVYWHRYDFVATIVRGGPNEAWRTDTQLAEKATSVPDRLAPLNDRHASITPSGLYHPASDVQDAQDLGGYIMGQKKS
ncbi:MAG: hypothetical protein IVW56_12245 [Candidatus Binataceae bacterium]|nr:hypothetical protein [Candidatus Binataceae bacterium]